MAIALAIAGVVALVSAIIAWRLSAVAREHKREAFIREYQFPKGLLARLAEKRPTLSTKEQQIGRAHV